MTKSVSYEHIIKQNEALITKAEQALAAAEEHKQTYKKAIIHCAQQWQKAYKKQLINVAYKKSCKASSTDRVHTLAKAVAYMMQKASQQLKQISPIRRHKRRKHALTI